MPNLSRLYHYFIKQNGEFLFIIRLVVESEYSSDDYDRSYHPQDEIARAFARHIAGVEISTKINEWWFDRESIEKVGMRLNSLEELPNDTVSFWKEVEKISPEYIPQGDIGVVLSEDRMVQKVLALQLLTQFAYGDLSGDLLPGEMVDAIVYWK